MELKVLLKLLSLPSEFDIHFQPIFSANKYQIIGYEALLRAYDKFGHRIDPVRIFADAKKFGISIEFDRVVRERAIEKFASLGGKNSVLFLNFESSIIDEGVTGSGKLLESVKNYGLEPSQVAIELKESSVANSLDLIRFCNIQKRNGFLITLDDVGNKISNLSRFSQLQPDVIKLDQNLIKNIKENSFASIMIRSITDMFHSTGTMVVASGIETLGEALESTVLGVDFLQGYFLGYPDLKLKEDDNSIREKMHELAICKKDYYHHIKTDKEASIARLDEIAYEFINLLQNNHSSFKENATLFLQNHNNLDAIYILNSDGTLLDETVMRENKINVLFNPGFKDEDFSLSEYYYMVTDSENGKYLTNKYISKANGKTCQTFSKKFTTNGKEYILCLDERVQC